MAAAPAAQNFRVNTSDYLGYQYKQYCDSLRGLSLSQPRELVAIRKGVTARLRDELVRSWFDVIYSVLSEGRLGANGQLLDIAFAAQPGDGMEGILGPPHYPQQKCSQVAMSAAETLESVLDHVIDILLSVDYEKLAVSRQKERARAAAI